MPRKSKPLYNRVETSGNIKELKWNRGMGLSSFIGEREAYLVGDSISPYSEYIPLFYLFLGYSSLNYEVSCPIFESTACGVKGKKKWSDRWKNKMFTSIAYAKNSMSREGMSREGLIPRVLKDIGDWMECDGVHSVHDVVSNMRRESDRADIIEAISGDEMVQFRQRVYSGYGGLYSLFWGDTPHVLAVIKPEDFMYMKYKLLVDSVLDLTKVVVLIDRELDTPQFKCQPFRNLYREALKPKIMDGACQVWNVPQEFIAQKCFLEDFNMDDLNIIERKRALQGFVKEFYDEFYGSLGGITLGEALSLDRGVLSVQNNRTDGIEGISELIGRRPIDEYRIQTGRAGMGVLEQMRQGYTAPTIPLVNMENAMSQVNLVEDSSMWRWELPAVGGAPIMLQAEEG